MSTDRAYDVIAFGVTGFTGRLVAEYLAQRAKDTSFRWAIAGRSASRLAEVKAAIAAVNPAMADVGVIEARSDDAASLERMAKQTRVVITTVGPYAEHGEPLVAACVREGTDYVDITGEPDFVDGLLDRHDAAARDRGVRVVNCCGFDSIPHDLGVLYTVGKLPKGEPIAVEGFVAMKGMFSGGTWQSALSGFAKAFQRRPPRPRAEATNGRKVSRIRRGPHREPSLDAWVCPLPTIDPQIVLRSARAIDAYGPDFSYGHYLQVRSAFDLAKILGGVGAVVALAQIGPTRDLLRKVRPAGEGPSPEERARAWCRVTFQGKSPSRQVVTRVSGGDMGYTETAKMVSEAALCLAFDRDKIPARAGVLTPAMAMGEPLIDRLVATGIRFEVLETSE